MRKNTQLLVTSEMTQSIFTAEYQFLRRFLKQERKKKGFTQEQLSLKLNKAVTYVNKYELGERRLDIVELAEVANILDFDDRKLFTELRRINKEETQK